VLALFRQARPLDGPFSRRRSTSRPRALRGDGTAGNRRMRAGGRPRRSAPGRTDPRRGPSQRPRSVAHRARRAAHRWAVQAERCGSSRGKRHGRRDTSLEELIIRHALGMDYRPGARAPGVGVMMIPVPGPACCGRCASRRGPGRAARRGGRDHDASRPMLVPWPKARATRDSSCAGGDIGGRGSGAARRPCPTRISD